MQIIPFILDNNFIIDLLTGREGRNATEKYELIFGDLMRKKACYISSSSVHILDYIFNKKYSSYKKKYKSFIKNIRIVKTPSYIDWNDTMAQKDIEDYLIELSAHAIDAFVLTSDRIFHKNSGRAVYPDDYFEKINSIEDKINFIDLKRQYIQLSSAIEKNIDNVLTHGQYIMGPEIKQCEEKLAAYAGVKHCITMGNGTDSLLIAMMALGIKAGDEVITTPFTFIATGEMIALLGAVPVFVDIDPRTYNMDPAHIEKAITPRTKAIMPVSLYGQCADMDEINQIADRHGLPVIEDAAQSFGATYKGRKSCALSTIGSTSFFPSKPLGCYGDGGACFTDDDRFAKAMREIRVHGQDRRYHHPVIGVNGRMDTLQAAVVLAKLEVFDEEAAQRGRVGARYSELLKGHVVTPEIEPFNTSVYAQYTIQVDNREEVQERLKKSGTPTAVHYPVPLHLQPAFAFLNMGPGSFPVAETAARRVMSLPMHPYMTDEEIVHVTREVIAR